MSRWFLLCCALVSPFFVERVFGADDGTQTASEVVRTDVYARGADGYFSYRIPAILLTRKGTLLAFAEGRKTSNKDVGNIDLVLRRSTDGGRTWSPMQIVYEEGGDEAITIGNPCPVEDRETGDLWLAFSRNARRLFVTRRGDDGVTWDKPIEITEHVTQPDWYWAVTGPGHGIQLRSGRLFIPGDCQVRPPKKGMHSFGIYSDDHGKTWQAGTVTGHGMNECQAVELADGSVLMSMRNYLKQGKRAFATSSDGGVTWTEPELHDEVPCPVCEASILRYSLAAGGGRNRILYSGPAEAGRRVLTVRLSYDEGKSWPVSRVLHQKNGEYSDLVALPGGDIGCFYERDGYRNLTFARFGLEWLTGGEEPGGE
jgi:sialidase-1